LRAPTGRAQAVFPSDHAIANVARFRQAVRRLALAQTERCLVTFGIVRPAETGYGYIEVALTRGRPRPSVAFSEADAAKAAAYVRAGLSLELRHVRVAEGRRARSVLRHRRASRRPRMPRSRSQDALRPAGVRSLRTASVDVAILERADDVAVVDGAFGWSDVGSWAAVPGIWGTDGAGNAIRGESVLIDCADTLAFSSHGRLVAAIGVRDLVIVDSPDAVLVCPKSPRKTFAAWWQC
jgi:mannose-1-phosphate guanylyltransferase